MTGIYKTPAGEAAVRAAYAELLESWPVASTHLRLPTSLGETFVVASGPEDGPAVVLLHGSAANAASWMGDVRTLAKRFRVYAVDMIGEPGFSAPSRPPLASGVYAGWLAQVLDGLGVERAALVGISLGGWLALEFATKRPERVSALALLCPGGVGRHKNVLVWALPLLLLGGWGRKQMMRRIAGPGASPDALSAEDERFGAFMETTFKHFRPRTERLPEFSDEALARLSMPVLAVLGGRDVFIDSEDTRDRLARHVRDAEIVFLPEAGHLLIGHAAKIKAFLARGARLPRAGPPDPAS